MAFVIVKGLTELRLMSRKFDRLQRNAPQMAHKVRLKYGRDVKKFAQENARKRLYRRTRRSENLANTITLRTSKNQTVIEALASYAAAVETGTKPHQIPHNPYWGMRGKKHPGAQGYPAQHFMARALAKAANQFHKYLRPIDRELRKVVR